MAQFSNHERPIPGFIFGMAAAAALGILTGAIWLAPAPAEATPAYASQTGLACGRCHVNPAGGGPRNAFDNAFAKNGHKLPGKAAPKAKGKSGAAAPAVVTTEVVATGVRCGYYSRVCNPHYGFQPEFGYSDALMFRINPYSD